MLLRRARFEVFGKVQGVWFRKHTKMAADRLGVSGMVQNTRRGTVLAVAEGPREAVGGLVEWARREGSPLSRVDRVEVLEDVEVDAAEAIHRGFVINREYAK